jgi:hypothetical protein
MTRIPAPKPMPELPRAGQNVRWRNRRRARACDWEELFGPGPTRSSALWTEATGGWQQISFSAPTMGEQAIPEVWLALAGELGNGVCGRRAVSVSQP